MPGTKRKGKGDAWYLEVTIGTDFTGKPIRYNRTFHGSEKQAEKALAIFYADCCAGKVHKESSMKISELCETYKTEYVDRFLKKSTQSGVNAVIKIWINPLLGKKKISKLTRLDVQKFINHLIDKELSPKTIRNYYSVLRGMMDFAIGMDLIVDTPCQHITLPKKKKVEAQYYSEEDVTVLLKALDTLPDAELQYKIAIYIILFGGLRKGEVSGLNWEDINFEKHKIEICRTRYINPGGGIYEDTPKTLESNRFVSLPKEIFDMFKLLKAQQLEKKLQLQNKYIDSTAILQGEFGGALRPQVLQRWFTRFREKNNLKYIGLHGLRHTHASMLAYMGADKMQISKRLGHSQLSTTLNIYTHLFEQTDADIADNLSEKYLVSK